MKSERQESADVQFCVEQYAEAELLRPASGAGK